MTTLDKYFANGTHSGSKEHIQVKVVIPFVDVGSGEMIDFDSFKMVFEGEINTAVYKGDLDLLVELTDHNEEATSGPCSVTINKAMANKANYHVNGSTLILDCEFEDNKQSITINQRSGGKETEIKLSGKYEQEIHLVPA